MPQVPSTLTDADYARLADFRFALRQFSGFSAAAAQAAGLAPQQHQALLAIRGHRDGPLTVGGLAARLLIAPHTAVELVGRLGAAGLVDKRVDSQDRRKVGLHLTTRAEKALADLSLAHLRELRELAPTLLAIVDAVDLPPE